MLEQLMHFIQIIKFSQRFHVIKTEVETSYTRYNKNALAKITRYHLAKQLLHTSSNNKGTNSETTHPTRMNYSLTSHILNNT